MIIYKSVKEIEKMREAGAIVKKTLDMLSENIKPGMTTAELDNLADDIIRSQGGIPSFKGYNGFPANICTSINDEVVHGIPGNRRIEEGQVIGIDVGVYKDGYHGDGAWTFAVGEVDDETRRLLEVGEQCLEKAIKAVRIGNFIGDVSYAIQAHAEKNGFSVVRDLVGHGIGRKMHEEPQVPNYGRPHSGVPLKAGLVIAIEPMVNSGAYQVKMLDDNWTIVTFDGKKSVHFEHTIAVTENGPIVLTG